MTAKLEKAKARLAQAEADLAKAKEEAKAVEIEAQARVVEEKFKELGHEIWELGRIAGFPDDYGPFRDLFQAARNAFCDRLFGARARLGKLMLIDKDRFDPDQEYGPELDGYTEDSDCLYALTTLMFDMDIDKNPEDEGFKEFKAKVSAVFDFDFAVEVTQAYLEGRHDT
jgi:hypothetical protein